MNEEVDEAGDRPAGAGGGGPAAGDALDLDLDLDLDPNFIFGVGMICDLVSGRQGPRPRVGGSGWEGTLEHAERGKLFSESFPAFPALEALFRNLKIFARDTVAAEPGNVGCRGFVPVGRSSNAMTTAKQRPIVKLLRRFLAQSPPNNVAPHVQPNQKLKAVIARSRGRLAANVQQAERSLLQRHVRRMLRMYS